MPDKEDISLADALHKAKQRLTNEYALDVESFRYTFCYYDVTDTYTPRWKFVFYTEPSVELMYRIELNARTGEIITTEAFPKEALLQDIEYDLKWY